MNAKLANLKKNLQEKNRERVSLKVVPEPSNGSRSILKMDSPGTIIVANEGPPVSYDCGVCGSPLLVDIKAEQVKNVLLLCANCNAYNESPA